MKAILRHKLILGSVLLLCLSGSAELLTRGGGGGHGGGGHGHGGHGGGHGGYHGHGGYYGRGGWGGYGWGLGTGLVVGAGVGGAYSNRGRTTYVTNNYDSNNCYVNRDGQTVCQQDNCYRNSRGEKVCVVQE